uniref:E3 ubiquitin-protein ligase RNF25 n=1 Tax=Caenorhabditis tropicalis TaxID=1561998 RepID=A0A1I7UYN4_9PELO
MEAADGEIEALCSIWEGVHVESPTPSERILKLKIKSLEDETTSASVVVEMIVKEGYPLIPPQVTISNPRGIGEPEFHELRRKIDRIIEENSDEMPIICEIFQECSDYLTENQHVNMDCSICLLSLSSSPIIVTSCDHFMHSMCFCRYLTVCLEEFRKEIREAQPYMKEKVDTNIVCPVCRESLTEENTIQNYNANIQKMIKETKQKQKTLRNKKRRASTTTEDVQNTMKRWHEEQRRLAKIYEKQKEKGGIIDIEEDKKRREFFIETGTAVVEEEEDPVI